MALTILNKSNDGMIKQEICPTLDIQFSEPYMMYKTSSDPTIKSIWFNDMSAFRQAQKLIQAELKKVKNPTKYMKSTSNETEPKPPETLPSFGSSNEKKEAKKSKKQAKKDSKVSNLSPKCSPKVVKSDQKTIKKSNSQNNESDDILNKLLTAERITKGGETKNSRDRNDSLILIPPAAEDSSKLSKKKHQSPQSKRKQNLVLLTPDAFNLEAVSKPIDIPVKKSSSEESLGNLANGLSKSQESEEEIIEKGEDPNEIITVSERAFARKYLIDVIKKDDGIIDGFIREFRRRLDNQ